MDLRRETLYSLAEYVETTALPSFILLELRLFDAA